MVEFESCSKCKFDGKSPTEEPCCICTHGTSDYYKPKSNADRIRSMSDEELAELFTQYSCEDADYTSLLPIEECKWGTKQEVINRNLQWLKSEAKE